MYYCYIIKLFTLFCMKTIQILNGDEKVEIS